MLLLFKVNNLLSRQTRLLSKVSTPSISVRFSRNTAKNAVQNAVQSTTPKTAHHTFTQAQTQANVCGRNAFFSSFSQTLQPRASQQARAQQAAANLPLGLNKIGIANSNNSINSNNTPIIAVQRTFLSMQGKIIPQYTPILCNLPIKGLMKRHFLF